MKEIKIKVWIYQFKLINKLFNKLNFHHKLLINTIEWKKIEKHFIIKLLC